MDYFGNFYQIVDPAALAEKAPFIYHKATITYYIESRVINSWLSAFW